MGRFEAVLFDLDGTLLYTLPDMAAALNHALTGAGYPERTLEEVRGFVGNGVRRLVRRALPPAADETAAERVYAAYEAFYRRHWRDHTAPYEGIRELLAALNDRGIRTGVVTNKTHADAEAIVRSFFGETVRRTEGKTDARPAKPAPDQALAVMSALGTAPERTLYVGDSAVDAETARNAGTACVLVSWGYREREELEACPALAVIDRPEELLRFVE